MRINGINKIPVVSCKIFTLHRKKYSLTLNCVRNIVQHPFIVIQNFKVDPDVGIRSNLVSEILINLFVSSQVQNQTFQVSCGFKFSF